MSATASKDVMQTCLKILQEKISDTNEPFSVLVPDLLVVLMNYGTLSSKLWSDGNHISFPRAFRVYPLNSFDSELNRSLPFPRLNLEKVLSLLRFNITTYPYFSESEKGGLIHLMLNLSMANFIVGDTFLILIIRDIICAILESFRAEEWTELDFKMVFFFFFCISVVFLFQNYNLSSLTCRWKNLLYSVGVMNWMQWKLFNELVLYRRRQAVECSFGNLPLSLQSNILWIWKKLLFVAVF